MIVVLNGPVAKPEMKFKIEKVLATSETQTWRISDMPFAEITPIGPVPVKFKLQVKFYYATSSTIGVHIGSVYDVIIAGAMISSLESEPRTS
jgi:hypothetical protein